MHAGDIKAGSERCDDSLIKHRFDLYQTFQRAFVFTPGDNEWTDCHRVNNGQYNPLERLAFVRSVFFPEVGHTTGGQVRPVRSQAEGSAYPEFVENVMFTKQSVMFATVHVVGSNNGLEPWLGIAPPTDSCGSPRADRIAEFERRQAATLAWLDEVFAAAAIRRGCSCWSRQTPTMPPRIQPFAPAVSRHSSHAWRPERSSTAGRSYSRTAMTTSSLLINRCPTCCFRDCRPTARPRFTGSRCASTPSRAAYSASNRRSSNRISRRQCVD